MKHLLKNSLKGKIVFNLPTVSVIVATRDRPKDLADLLFTILDQSCLPLEVIIVDDSPVASARKVVDSLSPRFESHNSRMKYVKGSGDGLPAARNLGIKNSLGDVVLLARALGSQLIQKTRTGI